ncbi:DNA repair protein RecN [Planctomycetales bacterium]|nr:DNA repair protein RecN [Planctomycetales bacterium]GHT06818.1 DNA repair protein RecN [Planctomycetales bacterium]
MLEELYLQNFVIFSRGTLPFGAGLNVISGETGAGKSLLADALALALGARADTALIRSGCDRAVVKAVFSAPAAIVERLNALGVEIEDETLLFERHLRAGAAARMLLGGAPVSVAVAREIADQLLDLAAQNEHTRLYAENYQRELLDRFGKIDLSSYREIFQPALALAKRIAAGDQDQMERQRERERVRYWLDKIAAFNFQPDDGLLAERIAALTHREQIAAAAATGIAALSDNENSVAAQIAGLVRQLSAAAAHSADLAAAKESLTTALDALNTATRQLQNIELSETADLDALIARDEELKTLLRALDCSAAALPAVESEWQRRERELADDEFDAAAARREFDRLWRELLTRGQEIRRRRIAAGEKLAAKVNRELRALEMPQAKFSVAARQFAEVEGEPTARMATITASGLDAVAFMIAPNVGEPARALAQTASGGEAARTMLAIKTALAETQAAETLFFDEIDSGVGGRLGDVLGKKLRELAQSRQVIVITHLPQIAAYAHRHLRVVKESERGQTTTRVEEMTGEARVEEIAQMINGAAATATTREQAREMLAAGKSN